ncbi:formate dehydrogenase accessory sulfurtransferase FdhD [Crocinitomix catalasitica]|uniref:formate dehydrogenase accessory sulfurtransferase FdhD n=1 Tax=Crocinitomix catalasitica TaxID=184607 RepID=UPI000486618D|nr:formate dehydrogenase accessory sulfurtransferase FdhD [Crocinitomix catalasitica]
MTGTHTYNAIKIENGSDTKVSDPLTVEQALEISINNEPFTVVMQTPGNEVQLARGLLFAEDVIAKDVDLIFETRENSDNEIDKVNINISPKDLGDGYQSSRSLISMSSCGICGKRSLEDLQIANGSIQKNNLTFTTEELFTMQSKMVELQENFKLTGGCHGVAGFDKHGNLLAIKEDIGRHNAFDKVVGQCINDKNISDLKVIMFSGRISYEIIAKAFRAKTPILMAVSAPSSLAVDFAKEFGITLLAFARKNKVTCYANCERIKLN